MATHDINGREYARLDSLKPGDMLEADGDFSCLSAAEPHEVKRREDGQLYVDCDEGEHALQGQDDGDGYLVGLYPASRIVPVLHPIGLSDL